MSDIASVLRLGLFGVAVATVLAGVDAVTRARVEANSQRAIIESLIDVTGDSRLATLTGSLALPLTICMSDAKPLYDVRTVSTNGYGGVINLLVGIDATSRVTGVRVVSHHETPGIGDVIDPNRADWILNFGSRAAIRDGANIDAVTGATITTRAVIQGVRAAAIDHRKGPSVRCTHVLSD